MSNQDERPDSSLAAAPSHRIAFEDAEFLGRPELRSYRLALEYAKPQLLQREMSVRHTIVVFGSARAPSAEQAEAALVQAESELAAAPQDAELAAAVQRARRGVDLAAYYEEARRFANLADRYERSGDPYEFVVTTGGGPGIMEAANRGAQEAGLKTMAFNIEIPHEQEPNPYITEELCFNFHYFAIRKMHFLLKAKAMVVFPGGFGTLDELFETLTLIQTGKMRQIPIVIFGRDWWSRVIHLEALLEAGTIGADDLQLFDWADTAEQAWDRIDSFYREHPFDWDSPF